MKEAHGSSQKRHSTNYFDCNGVLSAMFATGCVNLLLVFSLYQKKTEDGNFGKQWKGGTTKSLSFEEAKYISTWVISNIKISAVNVRNIHTEWRKEKL